MNNNLEYNKPNNIEEKFMMHNSFGNEIHFSGELFAWNSIVLILLAVASFMVMINRIQPDTPIRNRYMKTLFGGLGIFSILGLFSPIVFGLLGINMFVAIILLLEYIRYDKKRNICRW